MNEVWLSTINFVAVLAINGNAVHSKNSVSIQISKEIVPFQQARVRIPNLGVQYINLFNWTSGVGFG